MVNIVGASDWIEST